MMAHDKFLVAAVNAAVIHDSCATVAKGVGLIERAPGAGRGLTGRHFGCVSWP
jgi:hypothetical protein